jgi:hypothetical protein
MWICPGLTLVNMSLVTTLGNRCTDSPLITLIQEFYNFLDYYAPTYQVIVLDWSFYKLLDQSTYLTSYSIRLCILQLVGPICTAKLFMVSAILVKRLGMLSYVGENKWTWYRNKDNKLDNRLMRIYIQLVSFL